MDSSGQKENPPFLDQLRLQESEHRKGYIISFTCLFKNLIGIRLRTISGDSPVEVKIIN